MLVSLSFSILLTSSGRSSTARAFSVAVVVKSSSVAAQSGAQTPMPTGNGGMEFGTEP